MQRFEIYAIDAGAGRLGISPMPGRTGAFEADFEALMAWKPALVLTMTTNVELRHAGAEHLPYRLRDHGCDWFHLPIQDFGAPLGQTAEHWPEVAAKARDILQEGGNVLAHCWGGQGRSGMAAVRVLVEMGEDPEVALARLRKVRRGAVETDEQFAWTSQTKP